MVMEKSWNMTDWATVMEFCYQSWNFTNFAPKMYQLCMFFATTKKVSIDVESPHFFTFSTKCHTLRRETVVDKIEKWSWKSHGKLKSWKKNVVKSVGTL